MKKNNNIFPKELMNTIYLGDTIKTLKLLPSNSVDMIFADPPYNMQIEGTLERANGTTFKGVEGSDWDEFDSLQQYRDFTRKWLVEAQRVLKKDKSSLWVIGSFQNIYIVGSILQDLGYWLINDIVWSKTNPTPNFMGTKFTNKQETLLWATPSRNTKYQFNYKTMKAINNGKQMTSVWNIPVASGNERIKDDNGNKLHPTQKPESLLYNVIISSSLKGDLILDPFMGSGTTGAVAKKLGRNFFGIERDSYYRKYAMRRIANETVIDDDFTNAVWDIKPPRVRFKDLIKADYIHKNELIYFKKSDTVAEISDVKELKFKGKDYGISKLGGILEGKKTNANGWMVWFVKRNDKYVSLDQIRTLYLQKELGFYAKKL